MDIRTTKIRGLGMLIFLLGFTRCPGQTQAGTTISFDEGWRFRRGGVQSGEYPGLNDSAWRRIDLPHDWSVEDLPGHRSAFSADAVSQVGGGFTIGGTGWYRKNFYVSAADSDRRMIILFDGVYMNADVWLNGHLLGNHPNGYTSFSYDLTDKILFGSRNVIAIQVKNEGANSRWYAGSGINRHVWLKTVDPLHIPVWGVSVTTPVVSSSGSKAAIRTEIINDGRVKNAGKDTPVQILTRILGPSGIEVARGSLVTEVRGATGCSQEFSIDHARLWSPAAPFLYTVVSEVYTGQRLTDRVQTSFGFRSLVIDSEQGLVFNGTPLKLKGGCYHNDNGPLGARSYDRAEERRVRLLKEAGYNAIRCSHNPPPPAFLDACDRVGMLVIDEAFDVWKEAKNPYDYHLYFADHWQEDLTSMVLRDRNHPSVIMWSIGNEIPDLDKPTVQVVAKSLADYIKKLDTTRAVTAAVNLMGVKMDPVFALFDVAGYNYGLSNYESDHQRIPHRVMMATESYPDEAFDYWMAVTDHPYIIGDFVWTAFDYKGEASIGWRGYYQEADFFPWNLAYCGDIDICGYKRPQSYYRDALWKPDQLSVFIRAPMPSFPLNPKKESWSKWNWEDVWDDWTWKGFEKKPLDVVVYSSCDTAELFLNNKSLGKKSTNRGSKLRAVWTIPYSPGSLKAVGYTGQRRVAVSEIRTAGKAAKLQMQHEDPRLAADGRDLAYIRVEVQDERGIRNPKADNLIKFKLVGPGRIVGVGNANPMSLESDQRPERKAWKGRCLVIVESKKKAGRIVLTATAAGIKPAVIEITSK